MKYKTSNNSGRLFIISIRYNLVMVAVYLQNLKNKTEENAKIDEHEKYANKKS